jgi:hypothetical protein
MEFVSRNFPWGFRRTEKGKITPRARFESIAIGSYWALQQRPALSNQEIHVEAWLHSQEFTDVTGADGANAISRLKNRIHFVRDHLLGD